MWDVGQAELTAVVWVVDSAVKMVLILVELTVAVWVAALVVQTVAAKAVWTEHWMGDWMVETRAV